MKKDNSIIIIGGGLSGLSLAYFLSIHKIKPIILEGSSRIGGRIQTINGQLETPMELGATWFSDMHQNLLSLLEELKLIKYPQFSGGKSLFQTVSFQPPQIFNVPESESPSYRIAGGTEKLIRTLSNKIENDNIILNAKVNSIIEDGELLIIKTSNQKTYKANKAILCLPPKLVKSDIAFSPLLPESISSILPIVQTWMAGSTKFVLEYKKPFWRNNGFSGMLFSHTGIVTEMHDHTNYEENKFGFTGFLNSSASSYSKMERQNLVLKQLSEFFGKEILSPMTYEDKIWADEFISKGENKHLRAHQNNGHPVFNECYYSDKLYFCGTETSSKFGGYMEGAIISAKNVATKILQT